MRRVPASWLRTTLGEACAIAAGVGFPEHIQGVTSEEIPVFKVGDISRAWQRREIVLRDSENTLTPEQARELSSTLIPESAIIFAKIGAAISLNRRSITGRRCLIDNNVMALVPRSGLVDPKYLFHYSCTLRLAEYARATAVPSIRKGDVAGIELPLPPLSEQQRIVEAIESYFTRLDDAVATLERVQRNLKRYRASVLKAAVEGRLVPTEAELANHRDSGSAKKTSIEVDVPEGWRLVPAGEVCAAVVSGSTPKSEKLFRGSGEIPFIKVYNLTMNGELNFSVGPTFISRDTHIRQMARSRVYPGDVLTNIVGPPLGKVAVVSAAHAEWNINQAIAAFRPSSFVSSGWLRLFLMSERAQSWLLSTARTTTSQVNLAISNCRRLPVPVPPLDIQQRIVDDADRLLSTVMQSETEVARELLRVRILRQSILKWAFEGRLVDQDPSDEPASVLLERIKAERVSAATEKTKRKRTPKSSNGRSSAKSKF